MDSIQADTLPFIDFVKEDKSIYPLASETKDIRTGRNYIDLDDDFRIGGSGGFLLNWDFEFIDTHLFTEVARTYERNKEDLSIINWVKSIDMPDSENKGKLYYCPHVKGTRQYEDFWKRETYRRRNGMVAKCKRLRDGQIVDLHITGDHYSYLNYGRINRTPTDSERAELHAKGDYKTEMIQGFPRLWDGDYWNFKIDLFIARNNYHLAKGKARGKGYSFKRGAQAANTLNLVKDSTVILAADILDYLIDPGATSDMVKTNLDWFEEHTHWKRLYLTENLEKGIELGYKTTDGGNKKFGFRSKLLSVSIHQNESAAIGKRALEIDFEEAGKAPNLEKALDVTLSSTEVGAGNVGTIRAYGTAGTKAANWEPFANVFFNPGRYKMMPFENVWDYNSRSNVCGFFHPQVMNMEPFMDIDGNSLLQEAFEYDVKDKIKQADELESDRYTIYVGQRANTPEEAFKRGGENLFTSIELSNQLSRLLSDKDLAYYRDGMVVEDLSTPEGIVFKTNGQLRDEGNASFVHPYVIDVPFNPKNDFYGCIREYFPPHKIAGVVPNDLYYITYDPVGKDKDSDLVIRKNSLNSIHVFMYPNNYANTTGDLLVASYTGRPSRMEQSDDILLKLCKYYNAKAMVEVDRGETVSNFRKWKALKWLYRDPTSILSGKLKENVNASYGISAGSGTNSLDGLIYFKDWLYKVRGLDEYGTPIRNFHYIFDIPLLKELTSFNISGNFDRISSAKLGQFILKAQQVRKKDDIVGNKSRSKASIHSAIGLYGYKDTR